MELPIQLPADLWSAACRSFDTVQSLGLPVVAFRRRIDGTSACGFAAMPRACARLQPRDSKYFTADVVFPLPPGDQFITGAQAAAAQGIPNPAGICHQCPTPYGLPDAEKP